MQPSFISVDAYGIHIGMLYIRFYALIIITGVAVATWLTARRAKQRGFDEEFVWNALTWVVPAAILGARLYHVFTPQPSAVIPGTALPLTTEWYFQNPLQILAIWNGGLGIYGGIVGGVLGAYLYCRRHKQPLLFWLDLVAPGMILAQAIGRWGNFVNHELYGAPSTLPWAIYIPPEHRLRGYETSETFHPLFLYESLWNFATFLGLLWVERRFRDRLRDGDLVWLYLMSYATIRFILDFVRLDSNGFGPLTTAQLVSIVTFIGAAITMYLRHRNVTPRVEAVSKRKVNG